MSLTLATCATGCILEPEKLWIWILMQRSPICPSIWCIIIERSKQTCLEGAYNSGCGETEHCLSSCSLGGRSDEVIISWCTQCLTQCCNQYRFARSTLSSDNVQAGGQMNLLLQNKRKVPAHAQSMSSNILTKYVYVLDSKLPSKHMHVADSLRRDIR